MTFAVGNNRDSGFTLLEVVVVTLILALALSLSYPSMSRGSAALHLRTASRDLVAAFRLARQEAITGQAGVMLVIDRREQKVALANALGEPLRAFAMPRDVRIQRMARADGEVAGDVMTVRFLPNGSLENAKIRLRADGGTMMQVVADALGGGARMEPAYEGSFP